MFQHSLSMRYLPPVKRSRGAIVISTEGRLDPVNFSQPLCPVFNRPGPIALEAEDM